MIGSEKEEKNNVVSIICLRLLLSLKLQLILCVTQYTQPKKFIASDEIPAILSSLLPSHYFC